MTPVRVRGLREVGPRRGALVLVETLAADQLLAFEVPAAEAARLARVLGLARCRRLPIYELIGRVASSLGGRVSGAILDAQGRGVSARVVVASAAPGGGPIEIPCHPADAVGLALQSAAPILATRAALARVTRVGELNERPAVNAWLEDVRPADFDAGFDRGARTER